MENILDGIKVIEVASFVAGPSAAVVGKSISQFSWEVVLYAILSLTIVRMLPVFLTLTGMNLRTDEKLFMGWIDRSRWILLK